MFCAGQLTSDIDDLVNRFGDAIGRVGELLHVLWRNALRGERARRREHVEDGLGRALAMLLETRLDDLLVGELLRALGVLEQRDGAVGDLLSGGRHRCRIGHVARRHDRCRRAGDAATRDHDVLGARVRIAVLRKAGQALLNRLLRVVEIARASRLLLGSCRGAVDQRIDRRLQLRVGRLTARHHLRLARSLLHLEARVDRLGRCQQRTFGALKQRLLRVEVVAQRRSAFRCANNIVGRAGKLVPKT
jgi:hypothetical protein